MFERPPARVCVLRLSALGDVCHTLPVVRTLQAEWPDTELTWVIGKLEAQLLAGLDGVELVVFDKRGGWREFRNLRRRLADRRFDVLLQMQAALRASLLARCIRAPVRLGFDRRRAVDFQWLFTTHRIAAREREHVMDGLFGFTDALGIARRPIRWDIPVPPGDRDWARRELGSHPRVVVISPCSSQRARNYRNWPVSHYEAVARYAGERLGARVVLTGGPSEFERRYARELCAALRPPPLDLIGRTSLKQLLAVLELADVLIGPDSGPVHLANAVGTPVIGLYATSTPLRTGPYHRREWTVNAYPEALLAEQGKRVEEVRWGRRVRDPAAMERIAVEAVTERLERLFAATGTGGG